MKSVFFPSLVLLMTVTIAFTQPIKIDFDALQETKPWLETEQWEPVPAVVTPGVYTSAPDDAIILFDGQDLNSWHKPKYGYGARMDEVESIVKWKLEHPENSAPEWTVKSGALIVKPGGGAIETNQAFGDCQLHIEWLAPEDPGKKDQGYSNSGVFLMGLYEIQILNSYENKTYANGQAGSMYKQHIPLVNASRPPGEWQSYDIVFMAPKFNNDGSLQSPATITAFHNGVLIQNHAILKGPCVYIGEPYYFAHPEKLPLLLQDHGDKVRFRNIWIREL
ncbi:MAG: DUF1080 domain-containing protein [Saprospiraceae bacterium]|nr:DUF1080 domain-containing protein [Saprospiraceae bacterium]